MTTHLISSTLKSTWHAGRFTLGSARLGVVNLAGVKSLLASGLVQPVLSRPALSQYRTKLHVRPAQSSYANVRVMPPAHRLHWQDGRVTLSRYREPPAVTPDLDMAEAVPRLRTLLGPEAVKPFLAQDNQQTWSLLVLALWLEEHPWSMSAA